LEKKFFYWSDLVILVGHMNITEKRQMAHWSSITNDINMKCHPIARKLYIHPSKLWLESTLAQDVEGSKRGEKEAPTGLSGKGQWGFGR